MAIIYPASGRDQSHPTLGGRSCNEYGTFCETAGIPKAIAVKSVGFHKDPLNPRPGNTNLKFQEGCMKDHLLDNPSLPVMFIRQGLFDRMLRINTTRFAALIDQFGP